MNIAITEHAGRVPVTVLHLDGQLDGQNFQELIASTREKIQAGARDILLDLEHLTYISSAGLVALHTIALMLRGQPVPDPEQGWAALKSMDQSRDAGIQEHLKLLNPRPEVINVLEMVGFTQFFAMFSDLEEAVQSF
jgi:anti-anti-sigma regulatory factor